MPRCRPDFNFPPKCHEFAPSLPLRSGTLLTKRREIDPGGRPYGIMKLKVDCQAPELWAAKIIVRKPPGQASRWEPMPKDNSPAADPMTPNRLTTNSSRAGAVGFNLFELARQRLVLRLLEEVPDPATHSAVLQAASQAAALATTFPFPLLVFPTLLEEAASIALESERRRGEAYWRRLAVTEL